jgi:hypothetical protein
VIRQMDLAFILIWMEHNTQVSGRKTNSMEKVKRPGQIKQSMKEIILKERNMGLVISSGQMAQNSLASSLTIILKGQASITGWMEGYS